MVMKRSVFGGTFYYQFLKDLDKGCDSLCLKDPYCAAAALITVSIDESENGCYLYMHHIYTEETKTNSVFWEKQCTGLF